MKMRGAFAALATLLLLAGLFVSVHRGARGRELGAKIADLEAGQASAEVRRGELARAIEGLRSRGRVVRAAEGLGLHLPSEEEFVILDLTRWLPDPDLEGSS